MKKLLAFLVCCSCLLLLSGCVKIPPTGPLGCLPEYDKREFYSNDGFSEYADYGKYYYHGITPELFEADGRYHSVTGSAESRLLKYIDSFEKRVEGCSKDSDLYRYYDFDRAWITEDDYMCIQDFFGDYDIYFFDMESQILYFFHNNT